MTDSGIANEVDALSGCGGAARAAMDLEEVDGREEARADKSDEKESEGGIEERGELMTGKRESAN